MRVKLYNLRDDIGEKHNLASELPKKTDELRQRLHEWRTDVGAQMPTRNEQYDPSKPEHDPANDKKPAAKEQPTPKNKAS
jgi:hypothetical protein